MDECRVWRKAITILGLLGSAPSSQTPRGFPQMFSPQMIDWARDKQTGAQNRYLYLQHENYLWREMERKSDHPADCQSLPRNGESITGRVAQSERASEITIIHHRSCILQEEPAGKQTIDQTRRSGREDTSGRLNLLLPLAAARVEPFRKNEFKRESLSDYLNRLAGTKTLVVNEVFCTSKLNTVNT